MIKILFTLLMVFSVCLFSCKDGNYKEIKAQEVHNLKSKKDLASIIKIAYPVNPETGESYTIDDSILIDKILKEYPHLEKLEWSHDMNLKMELIKVDVKKGVYQIFWKIILSIKENDPWVVLPEKVSIETKNDVKLFDLCNDCKWEVVKVANKDKEYILNGKKYIESIEVWNKIDKAKLKSVYTKENLKGTLPKDWFPVVQDTLIEDKD
jgi:hypothetical protein